MFFVLSKLLGFFAIPSNLVVLIGIVGLSLCYQPVLRARTMACICEPRCSGDPRPLAPRQCIDHPFGASVPAVGCDARGAGWDRRARWSDRWVGPRQRGGIERGGRTVDRGARVSA